MAEEKKLNVEIDREISAGVYSNFALVSHTKEEFVLDFAFIQPQAPIAKVVSRVVLTPANLKRLIDAVEKNFERYEKTYGKISPAPERKIGFE